MTRVLREEINGRRERRICECLRSRVFCGRRKIQIKKRKKEIQTFVYCWEGSRDGIEVQLEKVMVWKSKTSLEHERKRASTTLVLLH